MTTPAGPPRGEAPAAAREDRRLPRLAFPLTVTALFAGLAVFGALVHEPWFDEAQAWLLVRDSSWVELLTQLLRYEGHPPLWYLILWPLVRLGLPFATVNLVSVFLGCLGTFLFAMNRRVPWILRAVLPFTYYFAYQYTVIARSYSLLLPLLAGALLLYPHRRRRILPFSFLLGLLSLVSLHGMVLAGALALDYGLGQLRRSLPLGRPDARKHLLGLLLVSLAWLANLAILAPPPDLMIAPILDFDLGLGKVVREALANYAENLLGGPLVALGILVALVAWLVLRRLGLLFLLVSLGLAGIGTLYSNFWHEGLYFVALWFVFAASFVEDPGPGGATWRRLGRRQDLRVAMLVVFLLGVSPHLYWSLLAYAYDAGSSYSGAMAAAAYIEEHGLADETIYAGGFATHAILPFFERNLFGNYRASRGGGYWDWSTSNPWYLGPPDEVTGPQVRDWIDDQLAERPNYVLVSRKFAGETFWEKQILETGRYEVEAVFPGHIFFKDGIEEEESFVLFGPASRRDGPVAP